MDQIDYLFLTIDIVSKYELIPLLYKEVMTNVKVFGCSRRSFRVKGKNNTDQFEGFA
jgi:hypothetical protein